MQLGLLGISALLYLGSHYKCPSTTRVHSMRQYGVSKLQSLLAETAAYFAVTVVVSCFVRLQKTPTLYEIALLPLLIIFEVFLLIIHVFASLSIPLANTQHLLTNDLMGNRSGREQKRAIAFHTVCILVNTVFFSQAQRRGPVNTSEIFQIIYQCSPNTF